VLSLYIFNQVYGRLCKSWGGLTNPDETKGLLLDLACFLWFVFVVVALTTMFIHSLSSLVQIPVL